jgi:hypothetical protein
MRRAAARPRGAMIEIEGTAVLPGAGTPPATGWREAFDQTKGQ